jgi:hypothetical protein
MHGQACFDQHQFLFCLFPIAGTQAGALVPFPLMGTGVPLGAIAVPVGAELFRGQLPGSESRLFAVSLEADFGVADEQGQHVISAYYELVPEWYTSGTRLENHTFYWGFGAISAADYTMNRVIFSTNWRFHWCSEWPKNTESTRYWYTNGTREALFHKRLDTSFTIRKGGFHCLLNPKLSGDFLPLPNISPRSCTLKIAIC